MPQLAAAPSGGTTWLGATSVHSRDPAMPRLAASVAALVDHHSQLHVLLNLFDAAAALSAAAAAELVRNHTGGGGPGTPLSGGCVVAVEICV